MKIVILLLASVSLVISYTDLPDDPAYYEMYLKNETALHNLFGCVLDRNPCDDFGSHAKKHIPDILKGSCNGCDSVQKHYVHLINLLALHDKDKSYLEDFKAKYDPEGKMFQKLEDSIKNY